MPSSLALTMVSYIKVTPLMKIYKISRIRRLNLAKEVKSWHVIDIRDTRAMRHTRALKN